MIKSISANLFYYQYKVDPNVSVHFEHGQIADLVLDPINGSYVTVSSGINPIGIIGDVRNSCLNTTISGMINIIKTDGVVFETDQIQAGYQYSAGDVLYSSSDGKFIPTNLTSKISIAKVTKVYSHSNGQIHTIQAIWDKQQSTAISTNGALQSVTVQIPASQSIKLISGHNCNRCNTYNEYAESNQPDGTYKCYNCRVK